MTCCSGECESWRIPRYLGDHRFEQVFPCRVPAQPAGGGKLPSGPAGVAASSLSRRRGSSLRRFTTDGSARPSWREGIAEDGPVVVGYRAEARGNRVHFARRSLVPRGHLPGRPSLMREHDRLDAVTDVKLRGRMRDVRLDGRLADVELLRDLRVRRPRDIRRKTSRSRSLSSLSSLGGRR